MTIVIHKTEASRLAYEVSKLNVQEIWEFVDTLKNLEDIQIPQVKATIIFQELNKELHLTN